MRDVGLKQLGRMVWIQDCAPTHLQQLSSLIDFREARLDDPSLLVLKTFRSRDRGRSVSLLLWTHLYSTVRHSQGWVRAIAEVAISVRGRARHVANDAAEVVDNQNMYNGEELIRSTAPLRRGDRGRSSNDAVSLRKLYGS